MPANPPAKSVNNDSSDNDNLSSITTAVFQRNQAMILIMFFPLGLRDRNVHWHDYLPGVAWSCACSGTRYTDNCSYNLRWEPFGRTVHRRCPCQSAWAAFLPHVLAGELI